MTVEVGYVEHIMVRRISEDRVLPQELPAMKLTIAQKFPKNAFCVGLILAQSSRKSLRLRISF